MHTDYPTAQDGDLRRIFWVGVLNTALLIGCLVVLAVTLGKVGSASTTSTAV